MRSLERLPRAGGLRGGTAVAPAAIATYRSGMADFVARPCEWGDGCEEPAAVELTGTMMRPSTIQGDEVHALDAVPWQLCLGHADQLRTTTKPSTDLHFFPVHGDATHADA